METRTRPPRPLVTREWLTHRGLGRRVLAGAGLLPPSQSHSGQVWELSHCTGMVS